MIVLLTNDLMFQSRVSGAVRNAGKTFVVDRSVERLVERAVPGDSVQLVLIDLSFPGVDLDVAVPALKAAFANSRIISFGPHVDVERLTAAVDAGSDVVMTRGQFDRDLATIVSA